MAPAAVPAARIPRAVNGVMAPSNHIRVTVVPPGHHGTMSELTSEPLAPPSLEAAATRLAALLTGSATTLGDPSDRSDLEFAGDAVVRPLTRTVAPADVWAVDGGQCLVA